MSTTAHMNTPKPSPVKPEVNKRQKTKKDEHAPANAAKDDSDVMIVDDAVDNTLVGANGGEITLTAADTLVAPVKDTVQDPTPAAITTAEATSAPEPTAIVDGAAPVGAARADANAAAPADAAPKDPLSADATLVDEAVNSDCDDECVKNEMANAAVVMGIGEAAALGAEKTAEKAIRASLEVKGNSPSQARKFHKVLTTMIPTSILGQEVIYEIIGNTVRVSVSCRNTSRGAYLTLKHYATHISRHIRDGNAGDAQLIALARAKKIMAVAYQKVTNSEDAKNKFMVRVFDIGAWGLNDLDALKYLKDDAEKGIKNRYFYTSKAHEMAQFGGLFHRRYVCAGQEDVDAVIRLFQKTGMYVTEYDKAIAPVYGTLGEPPADLF